MKTDHGRMGKIVIVRMFSGEDVILELKNAIKDNGLDSGVILSIVGTLKEVKLQYFLGRSQGIMNMSHIGHYELTSGDGSFYRDSEEIVVHLHVNLCSPNEVLGGHLLLDSKVDATIQAFIAELKEADIKGVFQSRQEQV